jgi:hypothetical protein
VSEKENLKETEIARTKQLTEDVISKAEAAIVLLDTRDAAAAIATHSATVDAVFLETRKLGPLLQAILDSPDSAGLHAQVRDVFDRFQYALARFNSRSKEKR